MRTGKESCTAALFNLSDQDRKDYQIELPEKMKAEVLLYTDWEMYGGKTPTGSETIRQTGTDLSVSLSRFSGMILKLSYYV
ncbi:MAG: alpha amylase C-terminal domain-containing protein [Solobacterium sp.]|nr:alpha amylase C-terminal domain-containing protein [Solobacterium sp.]